MKITFARHLLRGITKFGFLERLVIWDGGPTRCFVLINFCNPKRIDPELAKVSQGWKKARISLLMRQNLQQPKKILLYLPFVKG